MSEENAFLEALLADPGDDVTRLVYADWLEERGDTRGAYLRAEQELAALAEDDARFAALGEEVRRRCGALDADWLFVAGKRWDVWLMRYERTPKIDVIRTLRQLVNCGLFEGKTLAESLPACVVRNSPRSQAEGFLAHLIATGADRNPPLCDVTAVIRACGDPYGPLSIHQPPTYYDLILIEPRPGQGAFLQETIQKAFPWSGALAQGNLDEQLPEVLGRYATETLARSAGERLGDSALLEVRRVDPQPTLFLRDLFGKGPFEVRLVSFPPDRKLAVFRAYREVTGAGPGEAKRWSEQAAPLVILQGVTEEGAEAVREKFAGLGAVEVREQPSSS